MNRFLLIIAMAALVLSGCQGGRGFSTASPDVTINKNLTVNFNRGVSFPEQMRFNSENPTRDMTQSGVGLFNLRHSANSESSLDSTLENATELRDMLNPQTELDVSPTP